MRRDQQKPASCCQLNKQSRTPRQNKKLSHNYSPPCL